MTEVDDWSKKQAEPLQLFDLANRWGEIIKVVGAGNAAGVVAAGAALPTFARHPTVLLIIKIGGVFFFAGVVTFALAFAYLQLAVLQHVKCCMLSAARMNRRLNATGRPQQTL
jgi:hypothetical protein